ncbi:Triosephosphate isomerase [gamma proteobacterium HdN1]|nr:Triosephosphate isomerase [gamma proteobacterium HdN1]
MPSFRGGWALVRVSQQKHPEPRPLVVGNWKMNGTPVTVSALLSALQRHALSGELTARADVAVCPASIFIPQALTVLAGTAVTIGAQNAAAHESGAYTGEVSAGMLAAFGVRYVILGHSERRALFGDQDDVVAKKVRQALNAGLVPIVCVGETLAERESGATFDVVRRQLKAVIEEVGMDALSRCVLAYEPVWAIGTGVTATPAQAQEVHAFLRQMLAASSREVAGQIQILYGGSVKASNAAELFACEDIDGGLIGGASLDSEEFLAICQAAK